MNWFQVSDGSRKNDSGHYEGNANGEGNGKLTAGYCARGSNPTQDGGKIGPEFTFGPSMDAALEQPVLLIKTARGGRSLNTEFRPPSAGIYVFSKAQQRVYLKKYEAELISPEEATKWDRGASNAGYHSRAPFFR